MNCWIIKLSKYGGEIKDEKEIILFDCNGINYSGFGRMRKQR